MSIKIFKFKLRKKMSNLLKEKAEEEKRRATQDILRYKREAHREEVRKANIESPIRRRRLAIMEGNIMGNQAPIPPQPAPVQVVQPVPVQPNPAPIQLPPPPPALQAPPPPPLQAPPPPPLPDGHDLIPAFNANNPVNAYLYCSCREVDTTN